MSKDVSCVKWFQSTEQYGRSAPDMKGCEMRSQLRAESSPVTTKGTSEVSHDAPSPICLISTTLFLRYQTFRTEEVDEHMDKCMS